MKARTATLLLLIPSLVTLGSCTSLKRPEKPISFYQGGTGSHGFLITRRFVYDSKRCSTENGKPKCGENGRYYYRYAIENGHPFDGSSECKQERRRLARNEVMLEMVGMIDEHFYDYQSSILTGRTVSRSASDLAALTAALLSGPAGRTIAVSSTTSAFIGDSGGLLESEVLGGAQLLTLMNKIDARRSLIKAQLKESETSCLTSYPTTALEYDILRLWRAGHLNDAQIRL